MTTTIVGAGGTHTPSLWLNYSLGQDGRNIIDELLDGTDAIALRDAGPRRGRAAALFRCATADDLDDTHALADDLRAEIAVGQVLELADTIRPINDMSFILAGTLELILEPTLKDWRVVFDYREVPS